jgi:hypothetical protein
MWLAEHKGEGHDEDLIAAIITDVQDPAAPIFGAARHKERAHHASGVVTCLGQIGYRGAGSISQCASRVGAMEIELTHVPPPSENEIHGVIDSTANIRGKFGAMP